MRTCRRRSRLEALGLPLLALSLVGCVGETLWFVPFPEANEEEQAMLVVLQPQGGTSRAYAWAPLEPLEVPLDNDEPILIEVKMLTRSLAELELSPGALLLDDSAKSRPVRDEETGRTFQASVSRSEISDWAEIQPSGRLTASLRIPGDDCNRTSFEDLSMFDLGLSEDARVLEVLDDEHVLLATQRGSIFILTPDDLVAVSDSPIEIPNSSAPMGPGRVAVGEYNGKFWAITLESTTGELSFDPLPRLQDNVEDVSSTQDAQGNPVLFAGSSTAGYRLTATGWEMVEAFGGDKDIIVSARPPGDVMFVSQSLGSSVLWQGEQRTEVEFGLEIDRATEVTYIAALGTFMLGTQEGPIHRYDEELRAWISVAESSQRQVRKIEPFLDGFVVTFPQLPNLAEYNPSRGLCPVNEVGVDEFIVREAPWGELLLTDRRNGGGNNTLVYRVPIRSR